MADLLDHPAETLALELVECWEWWIEIVADLKKGPLQGTANSVKRAVELLNKFPDTSRRLEPLLPSLSSRFPDLVTIGPHRQFRTGSYTQYALQLVDKLHGWVQEVLGPPEILELDVVLTSLPKIVARLGQASVFDSTELMHGIKKEMGGLVRDKADERDRFIYEQVHAGRTNRQIRTAIAKQKGWTELKSDNGVTRAYLRFAAKHGLPQRKRKPGRPKRP